MLSPQIDEVFQFWLKQWNQNFMHLVGKPADEKLFLQYDYYYVLRFAGKIGAIMSSAWQQCHPDLQQDSYYAAWPEAIAYLQQQNVKRFHKMGMIAADASLIPRGFKMTRVLIGCGMKFTQSFADDCAGVVSFPRPDTSVYRACVEWGARTVKGNLTMFNAPVNFILLLHSELQAQHPNPFVSNCVNELWAIHTVNNSGSLAA